MQADRLKNGISYGLILLCAVVLAWQIPAFANELSLGAFVRLILPPVVLFMVLLGIVQTWGRGSGLLHFHLYGGKLTVVFLFIVALLSGTLIIYYGPRFNLLAWPVFVLVVMCYFLAIYFVIVGKEHNALATFLLSLPWLQFVQHETGTLIGIFDLPVGSIALPIKGEYIFITSLFAVWAARRLARGRLPLTALRPYVPVVLLLLNILVSILLFTYGHNKEAALNGTAKALFFPSLLYILIVETVDTEDKLYLIVYCTIAYVVMTGAIQYYMSFRTQDIVFDVSEMELAGEFQSFGYGIGTLMAAPAALITPLILALFVTVKGRRYVLLTAGLLVYAAALQLLSFSRAHLAATLAGAACLLTKRRAILLAILALIVAVVLWDPLYKVALVRFYNIHSISDLTLEHLSYARYQGWLAAIGMLREQPILGVGMGNFHDYAPKFSGLTYAGSSPSGKIYYDYMRNAHNLFLNLGAQLGLVGLGILLLFLGMLLFELVMGLLAVRGSRLEPIGWGLLGVYVIHIILAMTGDGFWTVKAAMASNVLYWTFFALMVRLRWVRIRMNSGTIAKEE